MVFLSKAAVLLSVRHALLSTYFWEHDDVTVHEIQQAERGEQCDALMLVLYAPGQHQTLRSVHSMFHDEERLFAILDDIFVGSSSERAAQIHH